MIMGDGLIGSTEQVTRMTEADMSLDILRIAPDSALVMRDRVLRPI